MADEQTKQSPGGFLDKIKGIFGKDLTPEIRRSTDIEIHTWNGPDDPENPYVTLPGNNALYHADEGIQASTGA